VPASEALKPTFKSVGAHNEQFRCDDPEILDHSVSNSLYHTESDYYVRPPGGQLVAVTLRPRSNAANTMSTDSWSPSAYAEADRAYMARVEAPPQSGNEPSSPISRGKTHQPSKKSGSSSQKWRVYGLKSIVPRGKPPGIPLEKPFKRAWPVERLATEVWKARLPELRTFSVPGWFLKTTGMSRSYFCVPSSKLNNLDRMRTLLIRMNYVQFMARGGQAFRGGQYAYTGHRFMSAPALNAELRRASWSFIRSNWTMSSPIMDGMVSS